MAKKRAIKADYVRALKDRDVIELYGKPVEKLSVPLLKEAHKAIVILKAPDHLSYSQVNQYLKCGRQYMYRYRRQLVMPPSAAMTLGSAVDAAQNHNYKNKIESGLDEPLDVLTDVFVEDLKQRTDETDWTDTKPEDVEKDGIGLVGVFHKDLAPKTQPLKVQQRYGIVFGNVPYTFTAFVDLIAEESKQLVVIDNKTSGRAYSENVVRINPQLTAYAGCVAANEGGGVIPAVGFDLLVNRKKDKAAVQYRTTRTEHDIKRYWRVVNYVYDCICKGVYLPANLMHGSQANWVCKPEYCGYYELCHTEF